MTRKERRFIELEIADYKELIKRRKEQIERFKKFIKELRKDLRTK